MYHQKGGGNVSFFLKKIKKQNAYPCKLQKKLKLSPFHRHKCADQKYLWRSTNYQESSKSIIRFLSIVIWNLGKGKKQKWKNTIFDGLLIVNRTFHKLNILLENHIFHTLWIFIKPNVLYSWLKTGFFNIFFKRLSKEVLKI